MPPSADHVRSVTEAYLARHPDERDSLTLLFAALAAADDPTNRKTFPAHVTCSAIVINGARHVLHIVHKASGKLLAPGGHNELDDRHLRDAALRELHEEAGIPPSGVVPLSGFEDVPLDVDVHTIDANPRRTSRPPPRGLPLGLPSRRRARGDPPGRGGRRLRMAAVHERRLAHRPLQACSAALKARPYSTTKRTPWPPPQL